jgi:hypothetical protein
MNKKRWFLLLLLLPLCSLAMDSGSGGGEKEKKTPETPEDIARGRAKVFSPEELADFLTKTPITKLNRLLLRLESSSSPGDRAKVCRVLDFESDRMDMSDPRTSSLDAPLAEAFVESLPFIDVPVSQRDLLKISRYEGRAAFISRESSAEAVMLVSALPPKFSPVKRLRRFAEKFPSSDVAQRLSFVVNLSHILHQKRGGGGHCIPLDDAAFEELKTESSRRGVVPVRNCRNGVNFIGKKTLFPRDLSVNAMVSELRSKYFSNVVRAQSDIISASGLVGARVLYRFDAGYFVETVEVSDEVGVKIATAYPIFSLTEWQPATSICIAEFGDLITDERINVTMDSGEIRARVINGVRVDRKSAIIFECDKVYICDIGPELKRCLEDGSSHHDYRLPPNSIYIVIPKTEIDGEI